MEDLTKLLGTDLGFSVAHFLSINGEQTFEHISQGFRSRFAAEDRVNVAVGIAHILRRRPESTTSSARLIAIYVLYEPFAFQRPNWQHVFGPTFVILIKNEPTCNTSGLKPLGEVERLFLLHLLAVSAGALANRSPRELLTYPERMRERINAERYQELVTGFAMRTMDVRPTAMYQDPAVYELVQKLWSVPLPTQRARNFGLRTDCQEYSACDDEEVAFFLLYRRIATLLFPFDESFFLPGGLAPSELFSRDEPMARFMRVVEEGVLSRRLPVHGTRARLDLPHAQPTQASSSPSHVTDWRFSNGNSSRALCAPTYPTSTGISPIASTWWDPAAANTVPAVRPPATSGATRPPVPGTIAYVGVRRVLWPPWDIVNPDGTTQLRKPVVFSYIVRHPLPGESSSPESWDYSNSRRAPADWPYGRGRYREAAAAAMAVNSSGTGTPANSGAWAPELNDSGISDKSTKNVGASQEQAQSPFGPSASQNPYSLSDSEEEYFARLDSEYSWEPSYNCSVESPASLASPDSFAAKGRGTSDDSASESHEATAGCTSIIKSTDGAASISPPDDNDMEDDMAALVRRAALVTLDMPRQQLLLKLFEKRTDEGLICAVNEDTFEALINLNPLLAVYIFCRLISAGRAEKYFQRVLDMEVSLNVLDVVNRVTTAIFMPIDFLYDFLCKCYSTYVNVYTGDQSPYRRIVTLIISFTESLFDRKLIEPMGIRCEALHFCISHSNLSQALELYRELKSEEDA